MRSVSRHIQDNKIHYLLLVVVAIVVLAMNVLTTLKGDDYVYALQPGNLQQRCATFSDYIHTVPAFYATTNGRLADATERLFASLIGKPTFNIFNTLMLLLLIEGIYTLSVGHRRNLLVTSLLLISLGIAFPYPGETLMWMAGSFNYLWSSTLTIWLLCWMKYSQRWNQSLAHHLSIAAYAFVAGSFNESTSTACLLGLCVYFVLNSRQFTPVRRTALIAYLLGLCVILLSPALWNRLENGASVNTNLPLIQMASRRILLFSYMSLRFVTPIMVVAIMAHTLRHSPNGWKSLRSNPGYSLFAGSAASALAFGMIIERPYTFMVTVCMAVVLRSLYLWLTQQLRPSLRMRATAVCLTACAVGGALALTNIAIYHNYDNQIVSQMRNGPRQCIILASQSPVNSRWVLPDIYDNDAYNCAYRTMYSYYFDKDNVQFLSPEIWQRYTQGQLLQGAVAAPFVSSDSTIATTLLALPEQNYALMPLAQGFAPRNGLGKVFRTDIEQYWGKAATQRRYLLGSLLDHAPIRPYWLISNGKPYIVIASRIDDKVTSIEMKFYRDGKWCSFTFTRQ